MENSTNAMWPRRPRSSRRRPDEGSDGRKTWEAKSWPFLPRHLKTMGPIGSLHPKAALPCRPCAWKWIPALAGSGRSDGMLLRPIRPDSLHLWLDPDPETFSVFNRSTTSDPISDPAQDSCSAPRSWSGSDLRRSDLIHWDLGPGGAPARCPTLSPDDMRADEDGRWICRIRAFDPIASSETKGIPCPLSAQFPPFFSINRWKATKIKKNSTFLYCRRWKRQ